MHLKFTDVNEAFYWMVRDIDNGVIPTFETDTRNGLVLQVEEPVIVTYQQPRRRVLFNATRDANPFFHLFESLWMLAGRNDLAPLKYYVGTFDQFSDDGKTLNGAYGYRWRHPKYVEEDCDCSPGDVPWGGADQLAVIIAHLKAKPESRRAVLQMWTVEDDLLKIDDKIQPQVTCSKCVGSGIKPGTESIYCKYCSGTGIKSKEKVLEKASKDVCCNTCCYFSLRTEEVTKEQDPRDWGDAGRPVTRRLDITVCNRSNDLIWGALGANVVHFSILQEYMACALGVEVGVYNQFTNNLHVYKSNWKPDEWCGFRMPNRGPSSVRLVKDVDTFDKEVERFVDLYGSSGGLNHDDAKFEEPFLMNVAKPMCLAFCAHRMRDYAKAMYWCELVCAEDWQLAGREWLERRERSWKEKSSAAQGNQASNS